MSVFIRKIQRPKDCIKCPCFDDERLRCKAEGKSLLNEEHYEGRPDWCPIIDVLTEQDLFRRWIPVKERLPKGNGEYLVSGEDKVWVCEFMILGDVGGWCNNARNPCVKYWMPLPEPLKGEGNEQ